MRTSSYLHTALYHVDSPAGRSIVTSLPIPRETVLAVWGGTTFDAASFFQLPRERRQISVQIEDHIFLVPDTEGPAEWINHSCDPNAGMLGQIVLVALRDIGVGEHICYDYAMSDGSPYDEFECSCGAPMCRKRVTGNDWQRAELWSRYDGHFSPYLQRRIQAMQAAEGSPLEIVTLTEMATVYRLTSPY